MEAGESQRAIGRFGIFLPVWALQGALPLASFPSLPIKLLRPAKFYPLAREDKGPPEERGGYYALQCADCTYIPCWRGERPRDYFPLSSPRRERSDFQFAAQSFTCPTY